MIKFDNVSKASEIKAEGSKIFLDIKPKEKISDVEMADLISMELKAAHDVVEFDKYDRLISEAFNRSEDEISIEYKPSSKTIDGNSKD